MELKIPDPFLQKHLEEFQINLQDYSANIDTPLAVYRGCVVKAAIQSGWIDADVNDVSEMLPGEVVDISERIHKAVTEAQEIPKK